MGGARGIRRNADERGWKDVKVKGVGLLQLVGVKGIYNLTSTVV